MPWNNQGGGGWQGGGGGQGPWGGRPGGNGGGSGQGPGQPPDLEELIKRSQEKVRQLFPKGTGSGGSGISKKAAILIALLVVAFWGLTGFYRVLPEEQGVELVFGKLSDTTTPGLNWNWPAPIGSVETPQVTRVNRIEVGFRNNGRTGGNSREVTNEALMLTGDENIIDVNFVVLWKISNAADYLFNIRDPESTVFAAAESVMREIIGQTPIAEATTEGRRAIEQKAREQMQVLMNEYGAGILIDEVQLQKADPPQEVIDAFRDVQRAQADRERAQNEAEAFSNDIIPRARGEAERLLQEAQAYEQEVVARASGEAQRFKAVLDEYTKAKDVTVRRIYLETMEEILAGMNKVIIDKDAGDNGVVPYLPLPELRNRAGQSDQATPRPEGAAQ
ncbi:MAG: FtsH protease activity modulator HflK [Geminicoccaceae bacterium]|nr:FtsH protease activity modulator HflK [Geminicoccaceae bacterium]